MTANVNINGTRRLIGLTPANTSEATMLTASDEDPVVVAIYIANLTSSAANATVKWGNGTTDFAIIDTYSVAARSYLHLNGMLLPLRDGYTVKVTSGTNSALAFTIAVIDFAGRLGSAHEGG